MNPNDSKKTLQELNTLSFALRMRLEAGLSKEWHLLERAYPIAMLLEQNSPGIMDLLSVEFNNLCDAYTGLRAERWVEPYLELHANLMQSGNTGEEIKFKYGSGSSVWVAADRKAKKTIRNTVNPAAFTRDFLDAPSTSPAKAIVLELPSRSFLIVLNQHFGKWSLHIREFWPDIRDALKSGDMHYALLEAQSQQHLSVVDVVRLSNAACQYGNDLPGVDAPTRPHLSTFLDGSLIAGEPEAGNGLLLGDSRDRGYILSFKSYPDQDPDVSHTLHGNLSDIDYVAVSMACACERMREQMAEMAVDTPAPAGG